MPKPSELKALETVYKGYRFRSRLEARWAFFFTEIGWKWKYEPEGFNLEDGDYYLPDFYLPDICKGTWFEVKAERPNEREERVAQKLACASGEFVAVAFGDPYEALTTPCTKLFYSNSLSRSWECLDERAYFFFSMSLVDFFPHMNGCYMESAEKARQYRFDPGGRF